MNKFLIVIIVFCFIVQPLNVCAILGSEDSDAGTQQVSQILKKQKLTTI